jgi:parallel beta-helix repeat protein
MSHKKKLTYSRVFTMLFFGLFLFLCVDLASGAPVTYTITNTSGSPSTTGSLPWAVSRSWTHSDETVIKFNIPGKGPHKIVFNNFLWIETKVTIDARTQPGYSGIPLIIIDANGNDSAFILNQVPGSTIAGFQIFNFAWNAIATQPGADHTLIAANYIGFYWTGNNWWRNFEADLANWKNKGKFVTAVGIGIQSSNNIIEGNVISGVHNGISIGYDPAKPMGPDCMGNIIRSNFVGTTPNGSAILTNTEGALGYVPDPSSDPFGEPENWKYFGNNSDGIYLTALAKNTVIANNLSSGNFSVGIELLHETVEQALIYGNKCGVDITGSYALPNGELGIIISNGAHDNIVGGENGPNIFSGNYFAGIQIGGEGGFISGINNLIKGNIVGCNAEKTSPIGNQIVGIQIGTPHSYGNQIEGNVVVSNDWGIYMTNTVNNVIIGNFVGVTDEGKRLDNTNDGIVLNKSTGHVVLNNLAMYNGFNSGHSDWGLGIWNSTDSTGNIFSGNDVRENQNSTNTVSEPLPGCIYVDRYLGLTMTCAEYAEIQFRFHLDFYQNPHDPSGLYWKMDLNSLRNAASGQCCLPISISDLGFTIQGAEFSGFTLGFDLDFYPNPNDPGGLYWKMDLNSLSFD